MLARRRNRPLNMLAPSDFFILGEDTVDDRLERGSLSGNGDKETRIGVFICHCKGNISDVVDVRRAAEEVGCLHGVTCSTTHSFMCLDGGRTIIEQSIKELKLSLRRGMPSPPVPRRRRTTSTSASPSIQSGYPACQLSVRLVSVGRKSGGQNMARCRWMEREEV